MKVNLWEVAKAHLRHVTKAHLNQLLNSTLDRLLKPTSDRLLKPIWNRLLKLVWNRLLKPTLDRLLKQAHLRQVTKVYLKQLPKPTSDRLLLLMTKVCFRLFTSSTRLALLCCRDSTSAWSPSLSLERNACNQSEHGVTWVPHARPCCWRWGLCANHVQSNGTHCMLMH